MGVELRVTKYEGKGINRDQMFINNIIRCRCWKKVNGVHLKAYTSFLNEIKSSSVGL